MRRAPRDHIAVQSRAVHVRGTAKAGASVEYSHQSGAAVAVTVAGDGSFDFVFDAAPGENTVVVRSQQTDGAQAEATTHVYYGHRITSGNSQAAMLRDGVLYTWGRNELGQLGNGSFASTWAAQEAANLALPAMYSITTVPNLVSVLSRQTHMVALRNDGAMFGWGSNASGQLGIESLRADCGNTPCALDPVQIPGISDAIGFATGYTHTLVLRADGSVLASGNNTVGQLGVEASTPRNTFAAVPGVSDAIQLAATTTTSYALLRDGRVLAWGSNDKGTLGNGARDTDPHASPTAVPGLGNVISLAASNETVLALKSDGTVVTWGANTSGEAGIGDESRAPVLTPQQVILSDGTPLHDIESVAADGVVGLAVTTAGRVYAWGLGGLGQLCQGYDDEAERDLFNRYYATPINVSDADLPNLVVRELEVGAGGPAFVWTSQDKLFAWGWSFRGSIGTKGAINAWAYPAPILVYPQP